jgi:hypothetical protein
MAKKEKKRKLGYIDRLLLRYYRRKLNAQNAIISDELEIINSAEAAIIKNEMIITAVVASLLGALGVLFLYIPKYTFPGWFEYFIYYKIPYIEGEQKFAWVLMLYSIILAQIEIYLLVYFNARAVARIARANGFPIHNSPDFEKHIHSLIIVALEKKDRTIKKYGIDPYFGLSKLGLFIYMLIIRFKATISNMFVKLVVGRLIGRAILRVYVDMVGLLIYPVWNVYSSLQVIRESKLRIMAPRLIRVTVDELYATYGDNKSFENYLFHTLNFLSQVKRNYNFNLYLLTDAVIATFNISKPEIILTKVEFIESLRNLSFHERNGLVKLIIFGMIIDGRLTAKEKNIIQHLDDEGVSAISLDTTRQWSHNYLYGKGMKEYLDTKIFTPSYG